MPNTEANFDVGFSPPAQEDYTADLQSAVNAYNALQQTSRVAYREPLSRAVISSQTLQTTAKNAITSQVVQATEAHTQLTQAARDAVASPLSTAFELANLSGAITQPTAVSQAAGSGTCGQPDDQYPGTDWYVSALPHCDTVPYTASFRLYEGALNVPSGYCKVYGPDSHACCNYWLGLHGGYPSAQDLINAICAGKVGDCGIKPPPPPPACTSWDVVYDPNAGCSVECSPAALPIGGSYVVQGVDQVTAEAALQLMPCAEPTPNGGNGTVCPPPPTLTWGVWQLDDGTCYAWLDQAEPSLKGGKQIATGLDIVAAQLMVQQCTPVVGPQPLCGYDIGKVKLTSVANWCDDTVCDTIEALVAGLSKGDTGTFSSLMGFGTPGGQKVVPKWLNDALQAFPQLFQCLIGDTVRDFILGVSEMMGQAAQLSGSPMVAMLPTVAARAVVGLIEHWTGIGLEDTVRKLDYTLNYVSPTEIPGQQELNEAWLRGTIDDVSWQCLTKANNNCDNWQKRILYSRYTRPELREILDAWMRGLIDDVGLDQRLREAGVIRNDDKDIFKELRFEIPATSDIIRFMVRNVYDENIVKSFHLDDEFEQKFAGQLKTWADSQGVTDEAIRAEWRAHWQIPAPTQLYEMLRRLRHGSVDESLVTTIEDVRRALGENDILPFWRDRLIAVSYATLTRVDLRRMYLSGVIDRVRLLNGLQDIGYSQDNAIDLANFADTQLLDATVKSPEIKLYREGGVNAAGAVALLQQKGISVDVAAKSIDRARQTIAAESKAKCSQSIQKRYLIGDLSDVQTSTALLNLGLDPDYVSSTMQLLQCELAAKGKSVSAAELCSWVEQGIITSAEFTTRLLRLGYSSADAARIVKSCSNKIQAKQAAKILRDQKEKERQDKAAKKDAETLQKEKDRMAKARLSAGTRKAALAERLSRQLVKATAKLEKVSSMGYDAADQLVQHLFKSLQQERGAGPQTTADAITQAAASYAEVLPMEFGQHVANVLDAMLAEEETIDANGEPSP